MVVDAQELYAPTGAAEYVTKYLTKSYDDREKLKDLGFERRYSTSRGWAPARRRLQGTIDEDWAKVTRVDWPQSNQEYKKPLQSDLRFKPNSGLYSELLYSGKRKAILRRVKNGSYSET